MLYLMTFLFSLSVVVVFLPLWLLFNSCPLRINSLGKEGEGWGRGPGGALSQKTPSKHPEFWTEVSLLSRKEGTAGYTTFPVLISVAFQTPIPTLLSLLTSSIIPTLSSLGALESCLRRARPRFQAQQYGGCHGSQRVSSNWRLDQSMSFYE